MSDESNVDQEPRSEPVVGKDAPRPKRRGRTPRAAQRAPSPASDQPVDHDGALREYQIRDVYKARRVIARTWLGKNVTAALFAEEGEWIVMRPDGSKFVATHAEFRKRFALLEPEPEPEPPAEAAEGA